MWDLRKAFPFGRISIRNSLMFAAAMVVACFTFIFATAPNTYAEAATWNGNVITYEGHQYSPVPDGKAGDGRDIPDGAKVYGYSETTSTGSGGATQKAYLIYFAPGTDPPKATSATYATYDFDTGTTKFSNKSAEQKIELTPESDSSKPTTSCDSTFTAGIGWIVCPVTKFLAGAMDWMYGVLSSFLAVRPLQTNLETPLYRAWSFMRNFANVAFVMAFLVIIYSQVTSIGISNYSIKKLFPRLIIAAILVNVSYWVCAILVDVSNILGYSIQDLFIMMRNNLVGPEGNGWNVASWTSISGFILSGGTAAVAGGIGAYSLIAGAGGAVYMLVPILVGVIMAVLIALLVMAARQALITVLIILSPLAFVAYLLPNTEKYFDKWKDLLQTMLVMFPLFSIIFGGSQLAGVAIIQNANSINLIILGMAVQVAPLVVTPLLVKFSGGLIGRLAGMVNNPNKGAIDRTRKWATDRAEQHKARTLANPTNNRFKRAAQAIDRRDRRRKGWLAVNQDMAEANWANHQDSHAIHQAHEEAKMHKEMGEAVSQAAVDRLRTTNGSRIQLRDVNLRVAKLDVDVAEARANAQWENLRADSANNPLNNVPANLQHQAQQARQHTLGAAVVARQIQSAQMMQQNELASALEASTTLQQQAGGIDPAGAQRALAQALTQQQKTRNEAVDNALSVIKHNNLTDMEAVQLSFGTTVKGIDATDDVKEAAIKRIAGGGNIDALNQMIEGLDLSDTTGNANHRVALTTALKANSARPKYMGFSVMSEIEQGVPGGFGQSGMDAAIKKAVEKKLSAETLVAQDADGIARIFDAINRNPASYTPAQIAHLKQQIVDARGSNILKTRIADEQQVEFDKIMQL